MDTGAAVLKHSIMEWRDRQVIRGYELLNTAAIDTRNNYEKQLAHASILDSAWDPAGFANPRIDALFARNLAQPLEEYFHAAGAELAALDERLVEIGNVLAEAAPVDFPSAREPEPVPSPPGEERGGEGQRWLGSLGGAVASGASSLATYAAETADWLVQDKVGLRNRLRHGGAARIVSRWMGEIGEPRPALAQVIDAIEAAANEARIKAW